MMREWPFHFYSGKIPCVNVFLVWFRSMISVFRQFQSWDENWDIIPILITKCKNCYIWRLKTPYLETENVAIHCSESQHFQCTGSGDVLHPLQPQNFPRPSRNKSNMFANDIFPRFMGVIWPMKVASVWLVLFKIIAKLSKESLGWFWLVWGLAHVSK